MDSAASLRRSRACRRRYRSGYAVSVYWSFWPRWRRMLQLVPKYHSVAASALRISQTVARFSGVDLLIARYSSRSAPVIYGVAHLVAMSKSSAQFSERPIGDEEPPHPVVCTCSDNGFWRVRADNQSCTHHPPLSLPNLPGRASHRNSVLSRWHRRLAVRRFQQAGRARLPSG